MLESPGHFRACCSAKDIGGGRLQAQCGLKYFILMQFSYNGLTADNFDILALVLVLAEDTNS